MTWRRLPSASLHEVGIMELHMRSSAAETSRIASDPSLRPEPAAAGEPCTDQASLGVEEGHSRQLELDPLNRLRTIATARAA